MLVPPPWWEGVRHLSGHLRRSNHASSDQFQSSLIGVRVLVNVRARFLFCNSGFAHLQISDSTLQLPQPSLDLVLESRSRPSRKEVDEGCRRGKLGTSKKVADLEASRHFSCKTPRFMPRSGTVCNNDPWRRHNYGGFRRRFADSVMSWVVMVMKRGKMVGGDGGEVVVEMLDDYVWIGGGERSRWWALNTTTPVALEVNQMKSVTKSIEAAKMSRRAGWNVVLASHGWVLLSPCLCFLQLTEISVDVRKYSTCEWRRYHGPLKPDFNVVLRVGG
ncbi:hypothetical protein L484_007090 [Morus notabilis]|uniref:Uncharacterized protein n=1 Tax=Morus notabilis TaxID=981085 RepID=W9S2D8_9ROSA|nr:hypothetical protein L484_007090 [Morus notabilis]